VDFGGGVGEGAVGGAVDGFELPGEVGGGLVVEEEGEGGLDVGEGVGEGLGRGFGGLVAEPGGGEGGEGGGEISPALCLSPSQCCLISRRWLGQMELLFSVL
jgi:hypothetical protein